MTRTVQSLLNEARDALGQAGLDKLEWTLAEILTAETTRSGLIVGDLRWDSHRMPFAVVNRSLGYRLIQHGASWRPGLSGAFWIRLVIHPRFGFQAEIHDVDVWSLRGGT